MKIEPEGVEHLLFPSYLLFAQMPDRLMGRMPAQFLPGIPAHDDRKGMEAFGKLLQAGRCIDRIPYGRVFDFVLRSNVA